MDENLRNITCLKLIFGPSPSSALAVVIHSECVRSGPHPASFVLDDALSWVEDEKELRRVRLL